MECQIQMCLLANILSEHDHGDCYFLHQSMQITPQLCMLQEILERAKNHGDMETLVWTTCHNSSCHWSSKTPPPPKIQEIFSRGMSHEPHFHFADCRLGVRRTERQVPLGRMHLAMAGENQDMCPQLWTKVPAIKLCWFQSTVYKCNG